MSVLGPMTGVPFMGPRLGLARFYSLSSLIPTASVMRWGGFLREKTETVGRVTGLRRGGGRELHRWVCLQSPEGWGSHPRPFQPGFPQLCPGHSGVPDPL